MSMSMVNLILVVFVLLVALAAGAAVIVGLVLLIRYLVCTSRKDAAQEQKKMKIEDL